MKTHILDTQTHTVSYMLLSDCIDPTSTWDAIQIPISNGKDTESKKNTRSNKWMALNDRRRRKNDVHIAKSANDGMRDRETSKCV